VHVQKALIAVFNMAAKAGCGAHGIAAGKAFDNGAMFGA
jgi:hypothetical protein